ncbi:hypothetical protein [Pedobacter sp. CFBP9032]|uniref:hypothetical protein n=1 Tax=Pedobacter sp. CFBP9032 TaxID=3096539 RepID=UPI002A69951F|nr:hypothetical protein [Pedobacter sp. CFBP9032]MDY0905126.1 hypothetical protein [Pedobacter sp. CFBP9032]
MGRDDIEPYSYISIGDYDYKFITDNDVDYSVNFTRYWQEDVVNFYTDSDFSIFEFNFIQSQEKNGVFDQRISYTVIKIIDDFLNSKRVLYYVTQRIDGRAKELFKVYQLWYKLFLLSQLKFTNSIMKIDKEVLYESNSVEAYISVMIIEDKYSSEDLSRMTDVVLKEIYPNSIIKNFR